MGSEMCIRDRVYPGSISDLFWGHSKRSFTLQTTTPSFMSFKRRSNDPNKRLDQPSALLYLTLLALLQEQAIGERGDESGEMHQLLQPSWLQLVCSSQRDSVHASCSSSSSKMRIEMPTLVVSAAFALMCR